jgi:hypothetical protein
LQPFRTKGKIIALYTFHSNFHIFRLQMRSQKILDRMVASITEFSLFLISSSIKFWFVTVVIKFLNCDTFSNDLFLVTR